MVDSHPSVCPALAQLACAGNVHLDIVPLNTGNLLAGKEEYSNRKNFLRDI